MPNSKTRVENGSPLLHFEKPKWPKLKAFSMSGNRQPTQPQSYIKPDINATGYFKGI